ncbi:thioredoxin domain-containing protein [Deferrisoma palaeochoriense]
MTTSHRPNRLIHEKSPYLLQHAHNPVDWYPWGEEAFARAKAENRIVFLSIGYATCHWCHVMERESFEDPEVAAVLNTLTVPVKVDREERPDVDQVYMAVCQALTGTGGWPLTILLTPDREPFFAATYLPKTSRHGRIGVIELVRRAAALWQEDPDKVRSSARQIVGRLRELGEPEPGEPTPRLLAAAVEIFSQEFDARRGGFGAAPKFPTPHNLVFLVRRHRRTGEDHPLRMATETLRAMRHGGIFDHLGFGFHRYSTDADWLLPHFEKMLYDQAGLAVAYLEAWQATGDPLFRRTAREVLTYVLRDLRGPEGAFHSAEDADSEGVEGKFYVWTRAEILEVLGAARGERFCRIYGITEEGNFREEATGERTGANVLHLPRPVAAWAAEWGLDPEALERELEEDRARLLDRRATRPRPLKDDKVLTGWNGLMVSALARAAAVLGDETYAEAARGAAEFLWEHLRRDGKLLRRYRDGEAAVDAVAEDYAFLCRGFLDLYGADFDPVWLARALELGQELLGRFWDEGEGGLFDTPADGEALLWRPKEVYDGATPSANSVALESFARLGLLTGEPAWTERAHALARALAGRVARYPAAFTGYLAGLALLVEPTREVVIAGQPGYDDTRALMEAVRSAYAPETTVLLAPPDGSLAEIAPFTRGMKTVGGRAAAYVCQNFSCQAPITDPGDLAAVLREPPRAG